MGARELAPFQKIPDHYPKRILTLDEDPEADYEGIRRINALDWLMGETEQGKDRVIAYKFMPGRRISSLSCPA